MVLREHFLKIVLKYATPEGHQFLYIKLVKILNNISRPWTESSRWNYNLYCELEGNERRNLPFVFYPLYLHWLCAFFSLPFYIYFCIIVINNSTYHFTLGTGSQKLIRWTDSFFCRMPSPGYPEGIHYRRPFPWSVCLHVFASLFISEKAQVLFLFLHEIRALQVYISLRIRYSAHKGPT